jgi:hypothetical protein
MQKPQSLQRLDLHRGVLSSYELPVTGILGSSYKPYITHILVRHRLSLRMRGWCSSDVCCCQVLGRVDGLLPYRLATNTPRVFAGEFACERSCLGGEVLYRFVLLLGLWEFLRGVLRSIINTFLRSRPNTQLPDSVRRLYKGPFHKGGSLANPPPTF